MDVSLDVFPANVRLGDTTLLEVRVIVKDHVARAYGIDADRQPTVLAEQALAAPVLNHGWPYRLAGPAEDGGADWQVDSARGCGCGHPLKRTSRQALLALAGADA